MRKKCNACGKVIGSNGNCEECLKFKLETDASNMSESEVADKRQQAEDFLRKPPWYAKFMPQTLLNRFILLVRLLADATHGRADIPWTSLVMVAATVAYVVSPVDLIPDVLFPLGYVDDGVMVKLLFNAIGGDLRQYVQEKGLDPRDYGF